MAHRNNLGTGICYGITGIAGFNISNYDSSQINSGNVSKAAQYFGSQAQFIGITGLGNATFGWIEYCQANDGSFFGLSTITHSGMHGTIMA
jgi:hypothetical protein